MAIDVGLVGAGGHVEAGDEARAAAPVRNAHFLAALDEAQQRAVLSAIFAARRPISGRAAD
jgi:hypothetical protein